RLRSVHRRRRRGRAHGMGRVPVARLRSCGCAGGLPPHRRRPQPARSRRHAEARVHLSGSRALMPRAVVTGGAGFLGSHLSRALVDRGWEVLAIDSLLTGRVEKVEDLLEAPVFELKEHDVSQFVAVDGPVDAVLHFASPASPRDYLEHPINTLKVGSLGTHNTLGLAKSTGARYLLASTSEIYGDPQVHPQAEGYWGHVNPIGPRAVYDEAQRFAEAMTIAYHRAYDIDVKIVRIFNTYGPCLRPGDGRVVSNFLVQAMEGKPLTVYGDGTQTRSYCYVDDEVR